MSIDLKMTISAGLAGLGVGIAAAFLLPAGQNSAPAPVAAASSPSAPQAAAPAEEAAVAAPLPADEPMDVPLLDLLRKRTAGMTSAQRVAEVERLAKTKGHSNPYRDFSGEAAALMYQALIYPEDRPALLEIIMKQPKDDYTYVPARSALLQNWVQDDPAGMEQWLRANRELPDGLRYSGGYMLAIKWCQENPLPGLRRAKELSQALGREGGLGDHWGYVLFPFALKENPRAVLSMIGEMKDGDDRSQALSSVMYGLADRDPKLALELAKEEKQPGVAAEMETTALRAMVYNKSYPKEKVANYLLEEAGDKAHDEIWSYLTKNWIKEDPKAAEAWLREHEADIPPGMTFDIVSEEIRRDKMGPEESFREILSWPEGMKRGQRLQWAAQAYALDNPRAAIDLLPTLEGNTLTEVSGHVVTALAEVDTSLAREAIAKLPAGPAQAAATKSLVKKWLEYAPAAAEKWLEGQPAGEATDAGITSLAGHLATRDSAAAGRWGLRIGSADSRRDALKNVVTKWAAKDAVAARRWLSDQQMPTEERITLSEALETKAKEVAK